MLHADRRTSLERTALDGAAAAAQLPQLSHIEFIVIRELACGEVSESALHETLIRSAGEGSVLRAEALLEEMQHRGLIERVPAAAAFRASRSGFEQYHRSLSFYRRALAAEEREQAGLSGVKLGDLELANRWRSVLAERLERPGNPMALRPAEDAVAELEKRAFKRWQGMGGTALGEILASLVRAGVIDERDGDRLAENSDFPPSFKSRAKEIMRLRTPKG